MFLAEITPEVILAVVIVVALLFGSSKIPKIARGLGSAKSEFEKGLKDGKNANAAASTEEQGTDSTTSSTS